MWISRLRLAHFRNYAELELNLKPQMVVFQGDNAQGKSNLLEAVYFLATTRSPRTSADSELINWNVLEESPAVARISAQVHKGQNTLDVESVLQYLPASIHGESTDSASQNARRIQKRFRVNGVPRSAWEFVGQVNVVMFSTLDIELLTGPPALRRRFLDIAESQLDTKYLRTLQQYNRILLQRNNLLRLIGEGRAQAEQLEFWNKELIDRGSYLIMQRRQLLAALGELARPVHHQLSDSRENLDVLYKPSLGREALAEERPEAISQVFQVKLQQALQKETYLGMTTVGPHRDDMQFLVNDVDIGVYGSRGQQRSVALSLKLAECSFMRSVTGEHPILLLDDMFSELDQQRRSRLLEAVAGHEQTLVTTTDLDRLGADALGRAAVFQIRQCNVSPLQANP